MTPPNLQLVPGYHDAPSVTPEDFLDVAGVCLLLHLDRREIYRAVHAGRLPVMRFGIRGKVWRFYKPDVLKLRETGDL